MGCHCLLLSCFICVQLIASLWTVAARVLCQWNYPGKNIGVGCHTLLQGIFPIQGSNPGLPHCRQILYCLSHQGSPTMCISTLSLFHPIVMNICFLNSLLLQITIQQIYLCVSLLPVYEVFSREYTYICVCPEELLRHRVCTYLISLSTACLITF